MLPLILAQASTDEGKLFSEAMLERVWAEAQIVDVQGAASGIPENDSSSSCGTSVSCYSVQVCASWRCCVNLELSLSLL
ncbi:hypothetical protein C7U60_15340 [Mesorhizobium plurifarium]|nr:hypothetical protein C7U60_15340 [Mesorhizobium plurifarium]